MKYRLLYATLLAFTMLFAAPSINAATAQDVRLTIHTGSVHLQAEDAGGYPWSNANFGGGMAVGATDRLDLMIGAFRNSYRAFSAYAGASYLVPVADRVDVGGTLLVATGYGGLFPDPDKPIKWPREPAWGSFQPLPMATLSVELVDGVRLHTNANPTVVTTAVTADL